MRIKINRKQIQEIMDEKISLIRALAIGWVMPAKNLLKGRASSHCVNLGTAEYRAVRMVVWMVYSNKIMGSLQPDSSQKKVII